MRQQQTVFENIVGKEETARNKQFLLFPQCFLLHQKIVSLFGNIYDIISLITAELEEPKLACEVKGEPITTRQILHSSKLKEFADDNFKFDENGRVIQMGRKHCGKRRNCSSQAISPFSTVFSKGLFPRGVKRCHCVGMG